MDIFKEIKKEHDSFKKMAEKISANRDKAIKTRTARFAKLKTELTAHHEAEEAILVLVLREKKSTREMGIEIIEAHIILARMLEKLESLSVDDETWIDKFIVINERLEKHMDEEEHEISQKAHDEFEQKKLDELGAEFEENDKQNVNRFKAEMMKLNNPIHFEPTIRCD